jgi:hypothetical protein
MPVDGFLPGFAIQWLNSLRLQDFGAFPFPAHWLQKAKEA